MDEVESIGDAVTGGLVAQAIEGRAGQTADGHTNEGACLNCGTPLTGRYCVNCGQKAHVHRTLGAFFHDLAHGVLHFEGKIWSTLPLLAWRPGELTRRYIDGERAKFVSPIALFLFSVFMMYAVVSTLGGLNPDFNSKQNLAQAERNAQRDLIQLEGERAKAAMAGAPLVEFDDSISDKKKELVVIRGLRDQGLTTAVLQSPETAFQTDVPVVRDLVEKARSNPQLLLYKLKTNSYKWSWALIPLSVPFLWLLFPFSRRFRLYDHVVFVTYSLAFVSLLIVTGTAISYVGLSAVAVPILFIPPWHMYRQLRGTYGLGRWGAVWRTAVLLVVAVAVLSTFIAAMIAMGLMG